MTASIEKLYYYFGTIGLASIAVWMCAVVLMLMFAVVWRRSAICWSALGLAILGLGLAIVNSHFVSEIKIDFSQELSAAKQRAEQESAGGKPNFESDISAAAEEAAREEAAQPSPAATSAGDPDTAGASASDASDGQTDESSVDPSGGKAAGENEPGYDYRSAGKVQRTEGKQVAERIPIDTAETGAAVVTDVRMMKNHEVMHANRLDRLNLFLARWTLFLAVCLVIVDYFRRFNSTFDCYLPCPLGGRLVDALFPKSHTVADAEPDRDWQEFLERAVRKGETFILFCDRDPWPDQRLSRLPCFLPGFSWRVEKVMTDDGENRFDDEFLFESAWFGRYCFVVVSDGPRAVERLETMVESLSLRRATRASARRTLNVVWNLTTPIPQDTLDRLLPLCAGTNVKLIVTQPQTGESQAGRFEEAYA